MVNFFFDLDGTLVDPKEGITQSVQFALSEMGQDVPHQDELTWMIGPPLYHSFFTMFQDEEAALEAVDLYRQHYVDSEAMFLADPYDGIGEMFHEIQGFGARIFIATSKPQVMAEQIVEHFGIYPFIEKIFGSELDGTRSDKTELLQFALDETGADPAKSVMIGDRRFDIFGAKNNDMLNIGALWGHGEADELHMAEADMLAGHPTEVPEIALDLLGIDVETVR